MNLEYPYRCASMKKGTGSKHIGQEARQSNISDYYSYFLLFFYFNTILFLSWFLSSIRKSTGNTETFPLPFPLSGGEKGARPDIRITLFSSSLFLFSASSLPSFSASRDLLLFKIPKYGIT
jgi:hypothetical protein